LTRRIKTGQIQVVLILIAVVAMLSWGVFAVLWTFPSDQGGTVNAVLNGENGSSAYIGKGNGTVIRPGSEAQYILDYQTVIQAGRGSGTFTPSNGQGLIYGPILWTNPSSTLSSFQVMYAVFSFHFSSQQGIGPLLWFSGPQGNLTQALGTHSYGGIDATIPFTSFQTSILEVSGPGNYTLHYFNTGSANATGLVAIGPSSVVFTRPYLFAGVTTIVLAVALAVVTGFVLRRRLRQATTGPRLVNSWNKDDSGSLIFVC
jgi:hypothetical protein